MAYYYYITIAGVDTEVHPNLATPVVTYKNTDEYLRDYIPEFKAKLTFNKKADFELLRSYENTVNQCAKIPFTIKKDCGTVKVVVGTGYLALLQGDWDIDKCSVDLPISIDDKYLKYNQNKQNEFNMFDAVFVNQRITVHHAIGIIEKTRFSSVLGNQHYTNLFFGYDPRSKGWEVYRFEFNLSNLSAIYNYFYAREVIIQPSATVMPPDWMLDTDNTILNGTKKWARIPLLNNYTKLYINNALPANGVTIRSRVPLFANDVMGDNIFPSKFDNGMKLGDVLNFFMYKTCSLTVKSDFFQINPVNVSSTNYVTGLASLVNHIVVYQKSDIKRPNNSENATIATTTMEKLILGLCKMFNLKYRIKNGVFELEHVSFFNKGTTIDLTLPKYDRYTKYKNRYTYKSEVIVKYEKLKFMEAFNLDFVGLPIEYIGSCITTDVEKQTKEIEAEDITTDVEFCLRNFDEDSNSVDDNGLSLIAAYVNNGTHYMLQDTPILDVVAKANNTLSAALLEDKYWKWERILLGGIINNNAYVFNSSVPLKKGVKITFPVCCDDVIVLGDYFKTQLGNGIVENASLNIANETMEVELAYEGQVGGNFSNLGGGGGSSIICLRPKSWIVTSIAEIAGSPPTATFNFSLEFYDSSHYYTQDEITFPSGQILIETNTYTQHTNPVLYSWEAPQPLAAGLYKFRKRLLCQDGSYSDWTPYTEGTVTLGATPSTCAVPALPTYSGRPTIAYVAFDFSPAVNEPIDVRYRHNWLGNIATFWTTVLATDLVRMNQTSNASGTTLLVKIGGGSTFFPLLFPPAHGDYEMQFRRVCSPSLTSAWSASVTFTI